jgi:hypothetical protein
MLRLHDSIIVIANMALEEKSSNEKGGWKPFFSLQFKGVLCPSQNPREHVMVTCENL